MRQFIYHLLPLHTRGVAYSAIWKIADARLYLSLQTRRFPTANPRECTRNPVALVSPKLRNCISFRLIYLWRYSCYSFSYVFRIPHVVLRLLHIVPLYIRMALQLLQFQLCIPHTTCCSVCCCILFRLIYTHRYSSLQLQFFYVHLLCLPACHPHIIAAFIRKRYQLYQYQFNFYAHMLLV